MFTSHFNPESSYCGCARCEGIDDDQQPTEDEMPWDESIDDDEAMESLIAFARSIGWDV
jgi:hypothetical protein